ncbi:MAG: signal recognition particle-docking protein FtsY [Planctomycetota bacterium]
MLFKKLFAPLSKLKDGLKKTRDKFSRALRFVFSVGRKIDDDLLEELEELLISADLGVEVSSEIVDEVRKAYRMRDVNDPEEIMMFMRDKVADVMRDGERDIIFSQSGLSVILVVGVNGSGKTTTVAKLARMLKAQGYKVMLAACDTFRAAAADQLEIWATRVGVPIIRQNEGADPAAVAYEAVDEAISQKADVLIVDTAGRLHTKVNLMKELEKVARVISKKLPGAPHETLIVLDGTTGQNALQQARLFNNSIPVTGIVMTKLDGTAKGGIAVAIHKELSLPIKFIGIGEGMDDMHSFDPDSYAEALFS